MRSLSILFALSLFALALPAGASAQDAPTFKASLQLEPEPELSLHLATEFAADSDLQLLTPLVLERDERLVEWAPMFDFTPEDTFRAEPDRAASARSAYSAEALEIGGTVAFLRQVFIGEDTGTGRGEPLQVAGASLGLRF